MKIRAAVVILLTDKQRKGTKDMKFLAEVIILMKSP